eukprot:TRINITY_DN16536_c0_g1_i1.p1 TRINITY_DN16536_c0_g1~~TRINITY_DN16536_c0_g1_i1.p1  ORF type:complete len:745 (-),score=97.64 TRINITY_DN16536_c0_g1_i1:899-3133(-)
MAALVQLLRTARSRIPHEARNAVRACDNHIRALELSDEAAAVVRERTIQSAVLLARLLILAHPAPGKSLLSHNEIVAVGFSSLETLHFAAEIDVSCELVSTALVAVRELEMHLQQLASGWEGGKMLALLQNLRLILLKELLCATTDCRHMKCAVSSISEGGHYGSPWQEMSLEFRPLCHLLSLEVQFLSTHPVSPQTDSPHRSDTDVASISSNDSQTADQTPTPVELLDMEHLMQNLSTERARTDKLQRDLLGVLSVLPSSGLSPRADSSRSPKPVYPSAPRHENAESSRPARLPNLGRQLEHRPSPSPLPPAPAATLGPGGAIVSPVELAASHWRSHREASSGCSVYDSPLPLSNRTEPQAANRAAFPSVPPLWGPGSPTAWVPPSANESVRPVEEVSVALSAHSMPSSRISLSPQPARDTEVLPDYRLGTSPSRITPSNLGGISSRRTPEPPDFDSCGASAADLQRQLALQHERTIRQQEQFRMQRLQWEEERNVLQQQLIRAEEQKQHLAEELNATRRALEESQRHNASIGDELERTRRGWEQQEKQMAAAFDAERKLLQATHAAELQASTPRPKEPPRFELAGETPFEDISGEAITTGELTARMQQLQLSAKLADVQAECAQVYQSLAAQKAESARLNAELQRSHLKNFAPQGYQESPRRDPNEETLSVHQRYRTFIKRLQREHFESTAALQQQLDRAEKRISALECASSPSPHRSEPFTSPISLAKLPTKYGTTRTPRT